MGYVHEKSACCQVYNKQSSWGGVNILYVLYVYTYWFDLCSKCMPAWMKEKQE